MPTFTPNLDRLKSIDPALYRSELHFRRLLDRFPAGAYTCDAAGLITYYNQQAVVLWGREPKLNDPADRFCGSFRLFLTDGTPITHDRCWMARALKEEKGFNGEEIIIERPDGGKLYGLAHANPVHDENGVLLGAVNVLVDITERKLAEQALRRADRAKDEFLATLAHELRNPLAPIRNAAHLLRMKSSPDPEVQSAIRVIERQLQQMTRLVDDLLDVGRITGNKLELRRDEIDLDALIDSAIEISQPQIKEAGHRLDVKRPSEKVRLTGDLSRLSQSLSNLLINAATYTPRGGKIELMARLDGSDTVIIVQDNGIGIEPDMLSGIFDVFVQAGRSPETDHGGLGIGLSLAKRVAERHGGSIVAASDGPGKGSTFTLRLPNARAVVEPKTPATYENGGWIDSSARRILVVDDNRDVVESMSMLLQLMGNDVRAAYDGFHALEVGAEFKPEVVLLDIGLPRKSGLDTAKDIRNQPWGKNLVMIAVTGWGQAADFRRSREAGFDHHVVKPMDPEALMRLVSNLESRIEPIQAAQ